MVGIQWVRTRHTMAVLQFESTIGFYGSLMRSPVQRMAYHEISSTRLLFFNALLQTPPLTTRPAASQSARRRRIRGMTPFTVCRSTVPSDSPTYTCPPSASAMLTPSGPPTLPLADTAAATPGAIV